MNYIKDLIPNNYLLTLFLFKQLAFSNKVSLHKLNVDSSLDALLTRLDISKTKSGNIVLTIHISDKLHENSRNARRLYNCYKFWIPYCLKLCDLVKDSFSISLNASDWGHDTFLSMTSKITTNIIPDEYSMIESKVINSDSIPSNYSIFKNEWLNRESIVFWRGSTTGSYFDSLEDLQKLLRIRACLTFKNVVGFDLKVTSIVQNNIPKKLVGQWLKERNILASPVDEDTFKNYKYHLDIAGNNTDCCSWGVIRKFLRGNLVFKTNHMSQMYYDRYLEPWIHFIPVEADFNDLNEKYCWAEENQAEAALISWRGLCVARKYLSSLQEEFIDVAKIHLQLFKS